MLQNKNKIDK